MSIFWPNVDEEAGRRSAVRRGFWGGVVITLITALGPPPMGAISLIVFGLVTLGIALKQPWAPRAGALAAYAPLLLTIRQSDTALVFGAFFQCTILAYFFFSAWRGLRARGGMLQLASGALWLALSLGFIYAWYLSGSVQRVSAEALRDDVKDALVAGDTVLLRAPDGQPTAGEIILVRTDDEKEPPHLERANINAKIDANHLLGVVKWIVWSDATVPTDAPIAYYTKARWNRFPKPLR